MPDASGDGVRCTGRILLGEVEERHDVASGCQTDAEDERILGGVGELVQLRRVEAVPEAHARRIGRSGKWCGRAIRKRPRITRNERRSGVGALRTLGGIHRQRGVRLVESGRQILRRSGSHRAEMDLARVCAGRNVEKPRNHRTRDRGPIGLLRDRYGDRIVAAGRDDIALPSAHQHDIPVGSRRDAAIPTVHDLIDQHVRRPREVHWFGKRKRRDVLDASACVARRQLEILDDAVQRLCGINFSMDSPTQDFVRACGPRGLSIVGLLARDDLHGGDLGPGACAEHGRE